ncbi:fasciclin domain-containing protein [Polaromonas sp. SM01]|uniref:fasciclin domain-containing protein n=1 Tax=Polaromonas sp. SM01 TaxID=3085630 RepID=UPI0029813679|nr:fasciclin domain-containing protein [Polaromonas sp. SM01]MDW5444937.1 fasciclin domain-containing protein [Polaromonas sp. SM01]
MFQRRVLFVAAVAVLVSACATVPAPVSVADTLTATPSLSTFNGLVVKAGLAPTLQGSGPFTVFAPNNEAFKAVPQKNMDALAKDPVLLKEMLTYHVLPVKLLAANVKTGPVKTMNGASLALGKAGEFVTVEEAMLQTADLAASNGVIHSVDRVMLPPKKQ